MTNKLPEETLHIYGQSYWHANAYIAGSTVALEALSKAINDALSGKNGMCDVTCNDGEGYTVHVKHIKDAQVLDKLAVPYTDEVAQERSEQAIWPWKEEV